MPVLKVKYGNFIRRFTVDWPYPTYYKFGETIRQAFKIPVTSEFVLTYIDEDKDVVVMACTDDLRHACGMGLQAIHLTIVLQDSPHPSAMDVRPHEPLSVDPPAWAVEIMLKLDQVLQAVNNQQVQLGGGSMNTISTKTVHQIAERLGFAVVDDSIIEPAKGVLPSQHRRFDVAQSGCELAQAELLRRAMILQQRVLHESDDGAEEVSEDSETYSKHEDTLGQDAQLEHESEFMRRAMILQQRVQNEVN